MAVRDRLTDRAERRTRRLLDAVGREYRIARTSGGLSQRALGRHTDLSQSAISRVELGQTTDIPLGRLVVLAEALGLELALRAYPAGDPIRDSAQVALLERLRHRLHPSLRIQTEVPLAVAGDRRAWDAKIAGHGWQLHVEAETVLHDSQAVERRIALKARDAGIENVLLLLADTRGNRQALAGVRESLRSRFPGDTRQMLQHLGSGADPGQGGIVIL